MPDEKVIIECAHNICIGYKKYYNHHVPGPDCWCKPTMSGAGDGITFYRWHKNYKWIDDPTEPMKGRWEPISERDTE